MGRINKYGLTDYIPAEVAREVRQRSGFGCVKCGQAIYQYEHFDPEFEDAKEHRPEGITLLCGGCHDRKTRGWLSPEAVQLANANPKCLQKGFAFGPFDVGDQYPRVICGALVAERVPRVICVGKDTLFGIDKPEVAGGPFRLNAMFGLEGEQEYFRIVDNEWQTPASNWDVEVVGPRIIVRRGHGDILLKLRSDPPHTVVLERLYFQHGGITVRGDENEFRIDGPDPQGCHVATGYVHDGPKGLTLGLIGNGILRVALG